MNISKTAILACVLALAVLALATATATASTTREFLGSFGALQGDGNGIAVSLETGDVYLNDVATGTVYVFNAQGEPISQITGLPSESDDTEVVGIAVDNSCFEHQPRLTGKECEEYDPSYGDIYASGELLSQALFKFKPTSGGGYELVEELRGVRAAALAVDSRGNIYGVPAQSEGEKAFELKKSVEILTNNGNKEAVEKLERVNLPQNIVEDPLHVAVDDKGDVYLGERYAEGERANRVARLKVNTEGDVTAEEEFPLQAPGKEQALGVDQLTGNVFVGEEATIGEYNTAGALQLTFGSSEAADGSLGGKTVAVSAIAVDPIDERVYVVNQLHRDVDMFGPLIGPPVVESQQPAASGITGTSALVAGEADPDSGQSVAYYFQYVDAEEYAPESAEPYAAGVRTGTLQLPGAHEAESTRPVQLADLHAGVTYHYRLVVHSTAGTAYGPDETFTTSSPTPPVVSTGAAVEVGATSATLTGSVDPEGLLTSYVFEVGTDTDYAGARLFGNAGTGTATTAVSATLAYLVPGMTYHYRIAATSFDGTSYGQDGTFTTPAVPATFVQPATLPLLSVPVGRFPSIAGASTAPSGKNGADKHTKSTTRSRAVRLAAALRACRHAKHGRPRAACERAARKRYRAGR
jgi:hypothetical protein